MDHTAITLKPVKELLGMNFYIPDYQRGYRWTAQQATDLLEDIWEFANPKKNKGHGEIYCVQPLVVQKKTEDMKKKIQEKMDEDSAAFVASVEKIVKGTWNVVDGQQRLTTIYLILAALGERNPYEIDYQTREGSKEFLAEIKEADANANIDYFHIYHVHKTAVDWFASRSDEDKKKFKEALLEKVNFIWYQIPPEEEDTSRAEAIAAFTRLNIGKIPLTDSELVKALFLNRTNFDCSKVDLETQQRKIAMEWDQIEYALQDDVFWLFLHEKQYDNPTRIDFILDMLCEEGINKLGKKQYRKEDKKAVKKRIGDDEHRTFRYFNYIFSDPKNPVNSDLLQKRWDEVREYFQIFNEWYHDYRLYHYVGYLSVVSGKKDLIHDLVKKWKTEVKQPAGEGLNSAKEQFVNTLKEEIVDELQKNKGFADLDNYRYDEKYKDNLVSKRECVPLLLLHNVETVIQQNDKLVDDERYGLPNFVRFPFHLYKAENWEVEHIRPNAGDRLSNGDAREIYALLAKQYLRDDELHALIDDYVSSNQDKEDKFKAVQEKILEVDKSLHDEEKNKLWNYTLLDSQTNKEYGNAIFPVKRAFLTNKERGFKQEYKIVGNALVPGKKIDEIAFVPPCTRNVFTKFYTDIPNGLLEWTEEDAKAYLDDIKDKLKYYLNARDRRKKTGGGSK